MIPCALTSFCKMLSGKYSVYCNYVSALFLFCTFHIIFLCAIGVQKPITVNRIINTLKRHHCTSITLMNELEYLGIFIILRTFIICKSAFLQQNACRNYKTLQTIQHIPTYLISQSDLSLVRYTLTGQWYNLPRHVKLFTYGKIYVTVT